MCRSLISVGLYPMSGEPCWVIIRTHHAPSADLRFLISARVRASANMKCCHEHSRPVKPCWYDSSCVKVLDLWCISRIVVRGTMARFIMLCVHRTVYACEFAKRAVIVCHWITRPWSQCWTKVKRYMKSYTNTAPLRTCRPRVHQTCPLR